MNEEKSCLTVQDRWIFRNFEGKFITLFEMIHFSSALWLDIVTTLQRIESGLEEHTGKTFEDSAKEEFVGRIKQINEHLVRYGLEISIMQCKRIQDRFNDLEFYNVDAFKKDVTELRQRIRDEFMRETILLLTKEENAYAKNEYPVFTKEEALQYPEIHKDTQEATLCMAFNRYTACVFHLSRSVEAMVCKLISRLKIRITENGDEIAPEKWGMGQLLNRIDETLAAKKWRETQRITDEKSREYTSLVVHLRAFKDAWRDPTAHPLVSYTPERAKEIFNASKSSIRTILRIL